jgi:hypothetical protein
VRPHMFSAGRQVHAAKYELGMPVLTNMAVRLLPHPAPRARALLPTPIPPASPRPPDSIA